MNGNEQLKMLSNSEVNYLATRDEFGLMIIPVDSDLNRIGSIILRGEVMGHG